MLSQWLCVAIGAVGGASLRWLIGVYLPTTATVSIPTLLVNIIGSFIMGALLAMSLSDQSRLLWVTGFLGSFTTFSALSANVLEMLIAQKYTQAMLIILLYLLGGIMAVVMGFWLGRAIG